jgi:hypothetical protein
MNSVTDSKPETATLVDRRDEVLCSNHEIGVAPARHPELALKRLIMKYHRLSLGLELGSAAAVERLTEIALLMRKTFPDCYWKRQDSAADNQDNEIEMHVVVNGRDESLRFTDRELISYSNWKRRTTIDHRMHALLARLLEDA